MYEGDNIGQEDEIPRSSIYREYSVDYSTSWENYSPGSGNVKVYLGSDVLKNDATDT